MVAFKLFHAIGLIWIATFVFPVDAVSIDDSDDFFLVGTGIYDITGPIADINFMGYAMPQQTGHGLHLRLRSRAFVISEAANELHRYHDIFVSADIGMGSDLLTFRVVERLDDLLSERKNLCKIENLSISGTHTHSGPAGFLQYVLYQFTSLGFVKETFNTFVEGIAQSLLRAQLNMKETDIMINTGLLFGANINRSPTSYLENPLSERMFYESEGDTDKTMLLLKFQAKDTKADIGLLNWFAVHGTSMNNTNLLVSSDNKGYASYLAEKHFNGNSTLPGRGDFVAAFASTNLGDVSPNTAGAKCIDTGLPCDDKSSSCDGNSLKCIGSGPGNDMFQSTEIKKQWHYAKTLFDGAKKILSGKISSRHSWVDMSNQEVLLESGEVVKTCSAALGYSFAAGTTDGPGSGQFVQGTVISNPFFDEVAGFLSRPSVEEKICQYPKPILINTGDLSMPYFWDPPTVPISIFRLGDLYEFTTMAGRRLRKAIYSTLKEYDIVNGTVTIAGLSNSYVHYVTTYEEYQAQRYEAASTLYGPHTLNAFIMNFERILKDLLDGIVSDSDRPPPDLGDDQLSFVPPVVFDRIGFFERFGGVIDNAKELYLQGQEAQVSFRSANPRNNQRIEGTFLSVDQLGPNNRWTTRYVDGDWCTKFAWHSEPNQLGKSIAKITWNVPDDEVEGIYRICHYGTRKLPIREAEILMRSVLDKLGFRGSSFILWAFSSSFGYMWNTLSLNSW
eukprot:CAMPEP_0116054652 /NCGR_PEP_ID=MMETSP0322-20121206/2931_1 /TAXON_ID=163516 /ORGANISM="Leptocylindrus danicus var. apora, Strain B651" /LENGTH=730 /DNA_ID=CAMNT_0003538089 /DNA_START=98 /DNA_END=2289 /DNA_ORIENTATION=+